MARTVQSQRKSSRVAKPPRRVPAFHNAKRLVKTLPAMKSMKSSGRYEPGARKGRPNTSTKWPKGVCRGKIFIVTSLVDRDRGPLRCQSDGEELVRGFEATSVIGDLSLRLVVVACGLLLPLCAMVPLDKSRFVVLCCVCVVLCAFASVSMYVCVRVCMCTRVFACV